MAAEPKDDDPGFRVTDRRVSREAEASAVHADLSGPPTDGRPPMDDASTEAAQDDDPSSLLPADFTTLVASLAAAAKAYLEELDRKESDRDAMNRALAQHSIDMLLMLERKTTGNLTGEEERLLSTILFEVRMLYAAKVK